MAALAGRYTLGPVVGTGGMATVYRAHDEKHGREVALKVLRPEVAVALGRDRFLREIRLAARLTHPHILALHDSGDADGILWFTMPLVQGETLRERLVRQGPLGVEEAVRVLGEVADALDYAHRHGIVHRDIKPENVLLHEGHAIVADFGIGKAVDAAASETHVFTQVGVTVGTPAYMSPEQAAGEPVDGRSDLFALGCLAFEMLTGEVAFSGPSAQATIARRFVHTPPPVSSLRPGVPEAVSRLVEQLMAKGADERTASGGHVVSSLRSLGSIPTASAPSTPHTDRSVVVLPFGNLSPDPENEYLSDGLTEETITALSRVNALRVVPRASAMPYKGTTLPLREIGDVLGVRWALTGSVRKAGDALRISAQLVDVRTDEPAWGETFSGTMDDVFDVQERVARAIVGALEVALSPVESARLEERPIRNVRAFELYLRAREALAGYDLARAEPLIERAVELEGEVPVLRALRTMGAIIRVRAGASRDPELLDRIEREARALIAEAPHQAWGHALLGYLGYETGEIEMAVRALRRALELDPADGDVRFFLGISINAAGHPDSRLGLEWVARDPLSPLAQALVGATSWFLGRAAEGLPAMQEAVRLSPMGPVFHWGLGYHYTLLGRYTEAEKEATWLAENAAEFPYTAQLRALLAGLAGRRDEALEILAAVDEASLDAHHTFHLSESYAVSGAHDRAVALLDRAVTMGFWTAEYYERICPFFEALHGRTDFQRIVARSVQRAAEFSA